MTQQVKTKPVRSGPPPLNRELGKILAALAKKTGAMDPRLASGWPEIVGPELAKICRPVRMKTHGRAKTLEIAVSHGAAAMQIQFKQEALRQKVNSFLGGTSVAKIVIRQTGSVGVAPQKSAYSTVEYVEPEPLPPRLTGLTAQSDLDAALERMKALMSIKQK